jgi:N-acetyl sugar amidotransferase
MIEGIQYCTRCCLPETTEGIEFDELGICRACNSSEQKMHINWEERKTTLETILNEAKKNAISQNIAYDCIVPISGGKDSVYQLHVITKVYGMRALAVTASHNWFSKVGWYNLVNALEEFDVDHMMYTPSRSTVNKAASRSLGAIGDACWHCHSGVGSYVLHVATKFRIPLLIWGESIAESSGRASYFNPVRKFDRDYFLKVSSKVTPDEITEDDEERRSYRMFEPPSAEECEAAKVQGIHLGDFLFWDEERQTEFIKEKYHWLEDKIEGTYKGYKSAECIMPGLHDFTNYLKRGYGRATVHASMDVRSGLLNREDAKQIAEEFDQIEPEVLNYYLEATGLSREDFYATMKAKQKDVLVDKLIPVKNLDDQEVKKPFVLELIEEMRSKKK